MSTCVVVVVVVVFVVKSEELSGIIIIKLSNYLENLIYSLSSVLQYGRLSLIRLIFLTLEQFSLPS